MDVERSSLCNCVVNFLLEEKYLLTAFELLHELLDDGRDAQAIRLKDFFSDPAQFPPDQITRLNSLRGFLSISLAINLEEIECTLFSHEAKTEISREQLTPRKELHYILPEACS